MARSIKTPKATTPAKRTQKLRSDSGASKKTPVAVAKAAKGKVRFVSFFYSTFCRYFAPLPLTICFQCDLAGPPLKKAAVSTEKKSAQKGTAAAKTTKTKVRGVSFLFHILSLFCSTPTDHVFSIRFPRLPTKKPDAIVDVAALTKKKPASKETPRSKLMATQKNLISLSRKDTAPTPGSQPKKGRGKGKVKAPASNSGRGVSKRKNGEKDDQNSTTSKCGEET